MFGGWRQSRKARRAAQEKLDQLNAALEIPPEDRDLGRLYPIILPPELLEKEWPGPILPLRQAHCAVGWAEVRERNVWTYVSHAMADHWEHDGYDWRRIAYQNLRRASTPGANGEKLDEAGRPFIKVMIQEDALGPSRLLIPHLFDSELGPDYQVAIPERTCAVAFRNALEPQEESVVSSMIDGCYRNGTEPMSPNRYAASIFWTAVEEAGW